MSELQQVSFLKDILAPTRRQVNAQGLLREVHAEEEEVKAGVGAQRVQIRSYIDGEIPL